MKKRVFKKKEAMDIVFLPALTPLEAAVLPAREKRRKMGALAMVPYAWEAAGKGQRAKI